MSNKKETARFRRDCIEAMVRNTCDQIHDLGNSPTGVSIREAAAYYLVRASYYEGDLEDVATELVETAASLSDEEDVKDYDLTEEELKVASLWNEQDVKTGVVAVLRQITKEGSE
jgi:hypothetical protein